MFSFFLCIYLSGTAGLYGNWLLVSHFEKLPDCFPQWWYHFTYLLAVFESSVSSYPHTYFSYYLIFFQAFCWFVKWYVIVIFICVPVITNDVEFHMLNAVCISSLEKFLFRSFAHFKIRLFGFLLLSCKSSLYVLDLLLIIYMICKCVFPFFGLSLFFLNGVKFSVLMKSSIFVFSLVACVCWYHACQRSFCWIRAKSKGLFSFKTFIALALSFRFLIHFELIFVWGVR